MFIVTHRKIFFALSAFLVGGSILAMIVFGFNFGIDFKGGSILEVSYPQARPSLEIVKARLDSLNFLGPYVLTPSGNQNFFIKTRDLNSSPEKVMLLNNLSLDPTNLAQEVQFNSIGPAVGSELKNKAFAAIAVVVVCIVLFVTFAFRKVSFPVASWKYGLATIVALAHDVIIPTGVFVIWSHFRGGEVDLLFVTALLAILGYSVHDTIVVFDRVRENLRISGAPRSSSKVKESFGEIVGKSVAQTFGRSINTSLTIFLALIALYFIGGTTTKDFAFVLLIGVITGTYSSIFVASPLLVTLENTGRNK